MRSSLAGFTEREREMGKKKIPIRRIEDKGSRLVTFTKRRQGLFKKAAELSILCGADIAIFTFSPAGKLYSFGHPCVDSTIDRYRHYTHGGPYLIPNASTVHSDVSIQLSQLERHLQAQLHRRSNSVGYWWDRLKVHDYVSVDELKQLKKGLEGLKGNVLARADELSRAVCVSPLTCIGFDSGTSHPAGSSSTVQGQHPAESSSTVQGQLSVSLPSDDGIFNNLSPLRDASLFLLNT
ncbi:MADS-box transcription factor 51-like [Magnolia sinica]|uniref:MADS-box transcription factor 51-like n=1 Tax=Magnolia sinica TaxID=86752 RepID=UPI00265AA64C|nr:MADS-box transcription factor 51-like [Magnolia sinica]